jgi:hypothetical protein
MSSTKNSATPLECLVSESVDGILARVLAENKWEGYRLTVEAKLEICKQVTVILRRLCYNINELLLSKGNCKFLSIDTIDNAFKLTFPSIRGSLSTRRSNSESKCEDVVDTLASYLQVFLRARLHTYNLTAQDPSLEKTKFMEQNKSVLSERNSLLFPLSSPPPLPVPPQ